jgi:vacuolar iron transporter family protein
VLERFPLEETDELAGLYERRGLPTAWREEPRRRVMRNPATALDVMAREELGIEPFGLGAATITYTIGLVVGLAVG